MTRFTARRVKALTDNRIRAGDNRDLRRRHQEEILPSVGRETGEVAQYFPIHAIETGTEPDFRPKIVRKLQHQQTMLIPSDWFVT